MKRSTGRLIPLVSLMVLLPVFGAKADTSPAQVKVQRASGYLRDDGRVGISIRTICDWGLNAFELDADVQQGATTGSVSIVKAGVVPCDDAWHSVRVLVTPVGGHFRHGCVTVGVFLGLFDTEEGDIDATASARVLI